MFNPENKVLHLSHFVFGRHSGQAQIDLALKRRPSASAALSVMNDVSLMAVNRSRRLTPLYLGYRGERCRWALS